MFSLSFEYLKRDTNSPLSKGPMGPKKGVKSNLVLPLERTAEEQLNYTKWFYSQESKKLVKHIKDVYQSESDSILQLNYVDNSFQLTIPENEQNHQQYFFLFDYIKDKIMTHGFELEDAVQEAISFDYGFVELEIIYLYNISTHQHVNLEIRTIAGRVLNIFGQCTSGTDKNHPELAVDFQTCVKGIFQI
jgi:hypothetical protein